MADIKYDAEKQPLEQGHQPPLQGYQPQPQGYQPPTQQGYPPAQPAYPPAQQGYPPTQPGYPPAHQGASNQTPPPPYPGNGTQPFPATAPAQTVIVRTTQQPTGPQPNDYLGLAIFVTVCCCLPFGIVAIVKSTEVRNRYFAGDTEGAFRASQSAKSWSMAGLITGIVMSVIIGILYGVVFATTLSY